MIFHLLFAIQSLTVLSTPVRAVVRVTEPVHHYASVHMVFPPSNRETRSLSMAAWTPGSYKIRDFARHVEGFEARVEGGATLAWTKADKSTWVVMAPPDTPMEVTYRVYCNDLSVRTNHIDLTGGHLNPPALLLYEPTQQQRPIQLHVKPPPGWSVHVPLELLGTATYAARDWAHMVDSPIIMGRLRSYDFEVRGIPHLWVILGEVKLDESKMVKSLVQAFDTVSDIFDDAPFENYTLYSRFSHADVRGGLEHLNSGLVLRNADQMLTKKGWDGFLAVAIHEYVHAWNVESIKDVRLLDIDYQHEVYTNMLWLHEGFTAYYDLILMARAGLWSDHELLERLAEEIDKYQKLHGATQESLVAASFDSWIHLYQPAGNSSNAHNSYYLTGSLLGLVMDLTIRYNTQNKRSLDDLMRALYAQYGRKGLGIDQAVVSQWLTQNVDEETAALLDRCLDETAPLPMGPALEYAGLSWRYKPKHSDDEKAKQHAVPFPQPIQVGFGAQWETQSGSVYVTRVDRDSPAWEAGLNVDDEVIAIGGRRVHADNHQSILHWFAPGDHATFLVARSGEVLELDIDFVADPGKVVIDRNEGTTEIQDLIYQSLFKSSRNSDQVSLVPTE